MSLSGEACRRSASRSETAACRREPALLPRLLLVFPTLHLAYGAGMLRGLSRPRFKKGARGAAGIEVRRVKAFGEPMESQNRHTD